MQTNIKGEKNVAPGLEAAGAKDFGEAGPAIEAACRAGRKVRSFNRGLWGKVCVAESC